MKTLILDGNKFSDIDGFYNETWEILTYGLDWKVANNLDALNDILYGGFGVYGPQEDIILKWLNFSKSESDLGLQPSIDYYEKRAAGLSGKRSQYFQRIACDLMDGRGETLIETIVNIIKDHKRITLITED